MSTIKVGDHAVGIIVEQAASKEGKLACPSRAAYCGSGRRRVRHEQRVAGWRHRLQRLIGPLPTHPRRRTCCHDVTPGRLEQL